VAGALCQGGAALHVSRLKRRLGRFAVAILGAAMALPAPSSFAAAAEEATLSRIYAGVHFRTDLTAGQELGRQIASFVINKFMTPLNATDGYDDGQSTSELNPHASSTRRAKYRSNQKVNLPSVSPIQGKGVPTQERKRSSEAV